MAREISSYTGAPELLDGLVKTLHPKIYGGILRHHRGPDVDAATMAMHDVPPIDLVAVNLYPFSTAITRSGAGLRDALENLDVGGPSLLRAAAKSYAGVAVLHDPADYDRVLADLDAHGGVTESLRLELAMSTFQHVAEYDAAIANYWGSLDQSDQPFGRFLNLCHRRSKILRYGENPHQHAALYSPNEVPLVRQIQGKELSFNNLSDADAAWRCVREFQDCACVIVKHANPCGAALGADPLLAYQAAYSTDPVSAFGGIIACNRGLDVDVLEAMLADRFVAVIIAPNVTAAGRLALAKRKSVRVLIRDSDPEAQPECAARYEYRSLETGLLVQDMDVGMICSAPPKVVTRRAPTPAQRADLLFAWKIVKHVKSNAIVYCRERRTIGIGAGQTSRVHSVRFGALKAVEARHDTQGAVMASDAFLPFRDGLDEAARIGIRAVIQPGGSIRDQEVIAAADEADMAMMCTGVRHFRHC